MLRFIFIFIFLIRPFFSLHIGSLIEDQETLFVQKLLKLLYINLVRFHQ